MLSHNCWSDHRFIVVAIAHYALYSAFNAARLTSVRDLEHWVESLGLDLGGLRWHIQRYWLRCLESAQRAHAQYLREGPLMRHAVRPLALGTDSKSFSIPERAIFRQMLCPGVTL